MLEERIKLHFFLSASASWCLVLSTAAVALSKGRGPHLVSAHARAGAVALVKNAIRAGIFNDLGSGSNVDITIIRKGGDAEAIRGYETPNDTAPLRAAYARPKALIPPAAATAATMVAVLLVSSSTGSAKCLVLLRSWCGLR